MPAEVLPKDGEVVARRPEIPTVSLEMGAETPRILLMTRSPIPVSPASADAESAPVAPFLKSALLSDAGFVHGFFTREGGVSEEPYASLNTTTVTGDDPAHVDENLRRIARALDVTPSRLYFLTQVHGIDCVEVDGSQPHDAVLALHGDTVVARASSAPLACAVRTADCVPVLLGCLDTGAVAACHAGWKGCARGALLEAVLALRARGATRLVAAIGPHISLTSFEVSEDVAAELLAASPDKTVVDRSHERPHVDLRKMARAQLESLDIALDAIDDVPGCTVLDVARFFSFRRDRERSGRLLSAIVPRVVA